MDLLLLLFLVGALVAFIFYIKKEAGCLAVAVPLLTKREAMVCGRLEAVLLGRKDLRLSPKVRVCDILEIHSESLRRKNFGRHIDFIISRDNDRMPVLCIEVNDASHDAPGRIARDGELAKLFAKSGVRLCFLRSESELSFDSLRELIQGVPQKS